MRFGFARRDRDADAAEARVLLQAGLRRVVGRQRVDDVLQALPRVAAVLGAEQAGADAAVDARAVVALVIPQRRVDDLRVGGLIATSIAPVVAFGGASTSCQLLPPSTRAVEAALRDRAGDVPGGRREHRCPGWSGRSRCARSTRCRAGPCWSSARRCRWTCRCRRRSRSGRRRAGWPRRCRPTACRWRLRERRPSSARWSSGQTRSSSRRRRRCARRRRPRPPRRPRWRASLSAMTSMTRPPTLYGPSCSRRSRWPRPGRPPPAPASADLRARDRLRGALLEIQVLVRVGLAGQMQLVLGRHERLHARLGRVQSRVRPRDGRHDAEREDRPQRQHPRR